MRSICPIYYNVAGGNLARFPLGSGEDYEVIGEIFLDKEEKYSFVKAEHIRSMQTYLDVSGDGITEYDLDYFVDRVIEALRS